MNALAILIAGKLMNEGGGEPIDGAHSTHPFLPDQAELIYGTAASIIVIGALIYFAGPMAMKAMRARTAKIQGQLDDSAAALSAAEADAKQVRQAAGDIDAERKRINAEADAEIERVRADGQVRIEQEIMELNARADTDIAGLGGRLNDELRVEISRLSGVATDKVFADGVVDDSMHQELIESFIARVGSAGGFAS